MTSDPNLSQVFDHWFKEMEADPAELPAFDADDQNGINTLMAFLDTVVDQSVESARSPTAPAPEQAPLLFFRTMETLAALIDSPPAAPDTSLSVLDELLDLPPHPSLVRPESAEKFSREHSPEYTNDAQPQASGNGVVKSRQFEQSMRVPIKQLDNLSNLVGELVVKRNRLEQDQERLRQFLDNLLNQVHNLNDLGSQMQDLYERTLLAAALQASRRKSYQPLLEKNDSAEHSPTTDSLPSQDLSLDALEMDRFTGFHLLSQAMIEGIVRIRESASDIQYLVDETDQVARSLRQVTTQLQAGMTQSRMVPFSQTADRLPRAIREISLKLNKQVNLTVEGGDVLVDKMILEHLYDPMTHLINNAITHGIETPAERRQAGKSPAGCLGVRVLLQGNQTLIVISDDGAGIDREAVKQKAIEKGLITWQEAHNLSASKTYDLLFRAGFSTKAQTDNFSGRGVGLDVVKTSLRKLRGAVSIDSQLGQGTTFTLRVPLTLSICNALCCLSQQGRIAFPMDGIEDTKSVMLSDILTDADGNRSVNWNNCVIPLHHLADLLKYNGQLNQNQVYDTAPSRDRVSLILVRGIGSEHLAIQVDQVIGEEEIVMKQIDGPIPIPPGLAGVTVRANGSIMPIGDVLALIDIAQGRLRCEQSPDLGGETLTALVNAPPMNPTVFIVDDSITVRELLSLSFKKAGFRVEQARDGQEAWDRLKSGLFCDLILCDIEMPRMNGLELLDCIQADAKLSSIPIAMITSRGGSKMQRLAAAKGARGYFVKPYIEERLLEASQRLIKGDILLEMATLGEEAEA